jgi:uncharacterized protein
MKIEVAKISKSGMVIEEDEDPQIMGTIEDHVIYRQPIHVKVSVNLSGHTLVVQGRLTTAAVLECNRCLKEFEYGLSVQDFVFSKQVRSDETVDLTESIREDIILALPMKRLCSNECKGLCPVCGRDLNAAACNCGKRREQHLFSGLDGLSF